MVSTVKPNPMAGSLLDDKTEKGGEVFTLLLPSRQSRRRDQFGPEGISPSEPTGPHLIDYEHHVLASVLT